MLDQGEREPFGWEEAGDAMDFIEDALVKPDFKMPIMSVTLGSGCKTFAERYTHPDNRVEIPYEEIPHFPKPRQHVAGHEGRLIIAPIEEGSSETMAIWSGRIHFYQRLFMKMRNEWNEIRDPEIRKASIGFYIAIARRLGVDDIITSNAVGSANPKHKVGDIIRVSDQLLFPDDDFGLPEDERWFREKAEGDTEYDYPSKDYFYDQAALFSPELGELGTAVAKELGWNLQEDILSWRRGRGYETPAQVEMGVRCGARLFGMSTAPEAQKARSVGYSNKKGERHFGSFSLVSNVAQINHDAAIEHGHVSQAGAANEDRFSPFMYELIKARVRQRASQ